MAAPIDTTHMPASVRAEGPKAEALYGSALQFEQLLVQQLSQSITDSMKSSSDDGGDEQGGGGMGVYQGLLPDALAQSVTSGGGMGLAMELYRSMGGKESK